MADRAVHGHSCHPPAEAATRTDPVCGMRVEASEDRQVSHGGETYYFCSDRCVHKFRADPEEYLSGKAKTPAPASAGVKYTSPMHPEIVRDGPGDCAICGMALEPMTVTVEEEANPDLIDMTRRFWVSAVLTLPLLLIAMGEKIPGFDPAALLGGTLSGWIQGVLATPVVLWAAGRFLSAAGSPLAA